MNIAEDLAKYFTKETEIRINLLKCMFHKYLSTSRIFVVLTTFMFLFLGYFPFHWETPSNFKLSIDQRLVTYDHASERNQAQ